MFLMFLEGYGEEKKEEDKMKNSIKVLKKEWDWFLEDIGCLRFSVSFVFFFLFVCLIYIITLAFLPFIMNRRSARY